MIDDKIKRCESCGCWIYLDDIDKLMGNPHFCAMCKKKKLEAKNAA